PKKNRKKKEKQEKVEVLQIKDIKVTTNETARFDVYVAVPYGDLAGPDYGEFAGSFVRLGHRKKGNDGTEEQGPKKKGKLKLGITPLLEDMDAEDADKLVVTLVLRTGSVTGYTISLVTPAVVSESRTAEAEAEAEAERCDTSVGVASTGSPDRRLLWMK
ncbi:hypothetical protein B296_00020013, partial [Ensete ventricosum]